MAGVGRFRSPEQLFEGMSHREWVGWQLHSKHFSTPLKRADTNSALERQVGMAPYTRKVPTVAELLPQYGRGTGKNRKTPQQLFELAQVAAISANGGSK